MVTTLKASGVRRVYGIPGDTVNGFMDALRRDGEITWEHVRHEEAAGFAAAAEAAVTGQLAVCAGSCGPGNLHLINGLFDANRSRVPVLAIAAQIPREEIGGNYFQETHLQELFRECSVYRELVSTPEQLPWNSSISRCARRWSAAGSRSSWCPARSSSPTPRPAPDRPPGLADVVGHPPCGHRPGRHDRGAQCRHPGDDPRGRRAAPGRTSSSSTSPRLCRRR